MILDQEACRLLEHGQPVRCVESTSRLDCVVIRADVFDRIGWVLDPSPDEPVNDMQRLLAETAPEDWKEADEWKGP